MPRFESFLERQARHRRGELLEQRARATPPEVVEAEWRPARLGRMGTILWADIDLYLEFVAIARTDPLEPDALAGNASSASSSPLTYLRF